MRKKMKMKIKDAGLYTKDGEKTLDLSEATLKDVLEFSIIKNGNK